MAVGRRGGGEGQSGEGGRALNELAVRPVQTTACLPSGDEDEVHQRITSDRMSQSELLRESTGLVGVAVEGCELGSSSRWSSREDGRLRRSPHALDERV